MALTGLSHYAIRVAPEAVEKTASFYADILGLKSGYRPPFEFPGAWLYAGESALVHLIGTGDGKTAAGTGRLDHIAFDAKGIAEMRAHLAAQLPEKLAQMKETNQPTSILGQPIVFTESGDIEGAKFFIFQVGDDGAYTLVQ